MGTNGPVRVADGNILDDDSRAQGAFKTDGTVELDLTAEGGGSTCFARASS
jgi:hypothetical protein